MLFLRLARAAVLARGDSRDFAAVMAQTGRTATF
jgi:hypothetical protein